MDNNDSFNPKEQIEYAILKIDDEESNHTYRLEQELLELVKSGDIEGVRKYKNAFPDYPKLLDYREKKNEEYMAVITIALVARAAIEVGLTSRESFQASDLFLKKVTNAKDTYEIKEIRFQAIETYTLMVKEKTHNTKATLHVKDCKQFIANNIFKKISTKDVALELNMNQIYLERIFREEEGISISQYILNEKMVKAKNLLKYSDKSISDISNYLGYTSQSRFGELFRKKVGLTPKQYRVNNKLSDF